MSRLLLAFAVSLGVHAVAPSVAHAQSLPDTIHIETCWYGVCVGIESTYHLVVPSPILAPNDGELWNSQGFAGYFSWDPFDSSVQLTTINFPVGLYSGSIVNGCLSGTTTQVYYGGYGDFHWENCP